MNYRHLITIALTLGHANARALGSCQGRCVSLETSAVVRDRLDSSEQRGLDTLMIEDFGLVGGPDIFAMRAECKRRAEVSPLSVPAEQSGLLLESIDLFGVGDLQAVTDYQIKEACEGS